MTPKLEIEAIRLGILPPKPDPFAWMQEAIYEPPYIPPSTVRIRVFAALVFGVMAIACVVAGALMGLSH